MIQLTESTKKKIKEKMLGLTVTFLILLVGYGFVYLEMAVDKPHWLQPNPPEWLERVKDQHWR